MSAIAPNADPRTEALGLRPDVILARFTTFRIGGPADWYAEPVDRDSLKQLVQWARDRQLPITVIGGGSNLLISDEGLRGLVLRLAKLKHVGFDGTSDVVCEAGVPIVSLLKRVADRGLSGLEGVVGVPGAVGGALVMNAGTRHGEFGDHVIDAEILRPDGSIDVVARDALGLGYRRSALKSRDEILLSVRLRLEPQDPDAVRTRMLDLDRHRHDSQPLNLPSAGCVWKNPTGDSAGRLVEAHGCKGMRVGGAEVSSLHGNFVVNRGQATAREVTALMAQVRARVQAESGIRLTPEVQMMGALDWEN